MGSIGAVRRPPAPQPEPQPTNWFTQNGFVPTYAPGPNQTQPVGPPVPYGNDAVQQPVPVGTDLRTMPQSGAAPTPEEVRAFVSQFPATYEGAQAADAAGRQRYGAGWPKLLDHPTKLDKWQFADGSVYDLMNSAGSPAASWVTRAVPEVGGHGGGALPGVSGGTMGGGTMGSSAPGAYAGASPGYEFRMKEGLRALQNSAAARGTLLTGGTLKDITRFGQDYATGEFNADFGRNLSLAQLGFNAANSAAQYGSAYGNQAGNLAGNQAQAGADLITGGGNAQASGTIGAANANNQTLGNIAGIASQIPYYYALLRR